MESWAVELQHGRSVTAWDLFLDRYRRLIFASIRHYARDYDDVMDVFVRVCDALREDDLARLRAYLNEGPHQARFSTWLVTVVRHLTIDWFRSRDGRRRLPAIAAGLPPLQRMIFQLVFLDRRGHVEAYEVIRSCDRPGLSFHEFLAALRETYQAVTTHRRGALFRELGPPPPSDPEPEIVDPDTTAAETREMLTRILHGLSPQDRAAVLLYVVDQLPAADVARVTGLPGPKAVYNHVYRALTTLRREAERIGLRAGDL